MSAINNRGRINRFKYMLCFYGLFMSVISATELPNLILLAAFVPILRFLSSELTRVFPKLNFC